jgi:hypothetical protein
MSHTIKNGNISAKVKLEKDPIVEGVLNLKVDGKVVLIIAADDVHNCVSAEVLDMFGGRSVLCNLDTGHIIHNVRS